MRSSLDLALTRAPVDRQTARAMSGGEHWEADTSAVKRRWDVCPALKSPAPGQPDHTGKRHGRFRVMGVLDAPQRGRKGGAAWVVRCDCGAFETRRNKCLATPPPEDGDHLSAIMCSACVSAAKLKRLDYFNRHGRWPT